MKKCYKESRRRGNKTNGSKLDWSHLAQELPSKTRYLRRDRKKDRSEGEKRKKM
jgi:hypothetical protein